MKKLLILLVAVLSLSSFAQTPPKFSIEGHRGARGWMPENTVPSFLKALELGADTVELDVVVSGDGKMVVSHDPWFPAAISLDPQGSAILPAKERDNNLHKMTYAEIKKYDVGSLGNKDFPQQQKLKTYRPLLSEVFREVRKYAKMHKMPYFRVNVEIKSSPQWDGLYTPIPAVFARMVNNEIVSAKMTKHVIVQSFDERPLQELKKLKIAYPLALLVGGKEGVEKNLARLGFDPDTYSPHYSLIDQASVDLLRKKGIKIIPWTVNEMVDLEKMKTFSLDGVITDYPDRAVKVFKQ